MNKQLQIEYLKRKNKIRNLRNQILEILKVNDNNARSLDIDEIISSRETAKVLWNMLPDEFDAYRYSNLDEQRVKGSKFLEKKQLDKKVIIHFAWDSLCFETTLENAWNSWYELNNLDSVETYNTCIFPLPVDWYIIRAGVNLYPMVWRNDKFEKE